MKRVAKTTVIIAAMYLLGWHIAFLLVFALRGDSVDLTLYIEYLHYIWTPGLEIPTAIQFLGVSLAVLGLVSLWTVRLVRARRQRAGNAQQRIP